MNLSICQKCKENPAVYGDGITWSRCSKCQYEFMQEQTQMKQPVSQEPVGNPEDSFEHTIVDGLTSIILPVYILNYTLFHYTGNCIGSVREHTSEGDYELVVIDNGSPVKPPDENSYYAHRVIKNEKNLGVTKAWNQGIRMSIGEYIVLLNNDVQVFDGWLSGLKEALDKGGYDLVMAHPMYSKTEPFARAIESKRIAQKFQQPNAPALFSTFKDFSCVMFKRSLIDEIGMFDEQFFNYASDSDFFKRMEASGKKWACAEYVATSHISDATGFSMPDTAKIMDQDKERYSLKWENIPIPSRPVGPVLSPSNPVGPVLSPAGPTKAEWTPPEVKPPKEGELARSDYTGDAVFLKGKDQKWHHVTNPDVLHGLGFELGQEKVIEAIDPIGEDITMDNLKNYE